MDDQKIPFYPHRLNQDGSYASICTRCYAVIATSDNSEDLVPYDIAHVCRPGSFLLRGTLSRHPR
jgi:hypothetical protein